MPSLNTFVHIITAFVAAHPAAAAWLGATLVAIYRSRTPAQWIALGESNPRIQGAIKAARGFGVDPAKLLEGGAQVFTGRVAPDPRDARIAALEAEVALLRGGAEVVLDRPTVVPPEPIAPAAFDPTAHITRDELPPLGR